jgi:nitroreductase
MWPLEPTAVDLLFRKARTYNAWAPELIAEATLRDLYELVKLGPTSGNVSPARFVFVATPEGKKRLSPHLSRGNHDKTMAAPVCVIVAYDLDFADKLATLFPHNPTAASWYADPVVQQETALRNSSLQGAYLIMAARALGYDCGPMSGFKNAGVDAEFFAGTRIKSNFLINVGHGDPASLKPRLPRLSFEEACSLA